MPARLPVGRALAITGSLLLGAGALLLFAWASQGWLKAIIVLALFAVGVVINGNRTDYGADPVTRALGDDVKVGIGTSATFVAAYLLGPLVLSFYSSLPRPTVVLLLIFGFPLLALLRFVSRDMVVGAIGAALLIPVLGAVLLDQAGVGVGTIALVALLVSVALFALVLAMPRNWDLTQPASVFGATAASFAVGAGTSSVGMLTAQQTDAAVPALPPAPQVAVLAVGLLVAVGFALVAMARHHLAAGLVAGSVLVVPPVSLVIGHSYRIYDSTAAVVVMIAIPALALVIAAIALFVPDTRRLLRQALPPHQRPARPVVGASALRAVIGIALVFAAQVVALVGHVVLAQGVLMTLLLAAGAALAWWVPATPGAVLACVVLVELPLDAPWWLLGADATSRRPGMIAVAVVGLAVTAALAWLLCRRHRRPGVVAAAAYALAGTLATALAAAVAGATGQLVGVVWLIGPLLLLGIPVAVVALRGRGRRLIAAQAAGVVLLAAGGFALARLLLPVTNTSGVVADVALAPLIPTSTGIGTLPGSGAAPLAALLLFVIAVPLLASTVRRPSVPLAVAGVFVLIEGAATALIGAAENWPGSSVDLMITVVLVVAVLVSLAAFAVLNRQARSTPTAP